MSNDRETATKLREAADVMRERGHTIRNFESVDGSVCLQGAVHVAYYGNAIGDCEGQGFRHDAAVDALIEVLPDRCAEHFDGTFAESAMIKRSHPVFHFNDFHCDGGNQAIEVLIQAAEKLEAGF